jgi:biopolymer transport protein ExbD
MRPTRRLVMPDGELDLSPMIDIVFNLLIFFMCATKFRTAEGAIEAYLPRDQGLNNTSMPQVKLNDVRILLTWHDDAGHRTASPEGHVVLLVGGQRLSLRGEFESGRDPALSPAWERLGTLLAELKATHLEAHPGEPLPVIIDARPQVPTQYAISALNEVVRAELKEVMFAAPERPF